MRARWIKFAGAGFLAGMVLSLLIGWLARAPGGTIVSSRLIARTGSEAAAITVQTLLSGLYGAATFSGMLLYELDRWSLVRATLVHYLIVAVPYAPLALLLGWAETAGDVLVMEGIQLAAFLLIWLVMSLWTKARIRMLNNLLKHKEENITYKGEKTA